MKGKGKAGRFARTKKTAYGASTQSCGPVEVEKTDGMEIVFLATPTPAVLQIRVDLGESWGKFDLPLARFPSREELDHVSLLLDQSDSVDSVVDQVLGYLAARGFKPN